LHAVFEKTTVEKHAPGKWADELPLDRLNAIVKSGEPISMLVLAADIRASTSLMKEAIDFRAFASAIGGFATNAGKQIRKERGWFDKFTGDGFLAYWLVDQRDRSTYFHELLLVAGRIMHVFREWAEPQLRQNSHNYPANVGISVGIDAGPGYLVEVANDLTIVGLPVVGAVRMVSVAKPFEAVVNVSLGEQLVTRGELLEQVTATIAREVRTTKEYSQGQVVYVLRPELD
jgi:class 3 adenylate cyclase